MSETKTPENHPCFSEEARRETNSAKIKETQTPYYSNSTEIHTPEKQVLFSMEARHESNSAKIKRIVTPYYYNKGVDMHTPEKQVEFTAEARKHGNSAKIKRMQTPFHNNLPSPHVEFVEAENMVVEIEKSYHDSNQQEDNTITTSISREDSERLKKDLFPRNIEEQVEQHEKLLNQWGEMNRSYSRENDAASIQEDLDDIKKEFERSASKSNDFSISLTPGRQVSFTEEARKHGNSSKIKRMQTPFLSEPPDFHVEFVEINQNQGQEKDPGQELDEETLSDPSEQPSASASGSKTTHLKDKVDPSRLFQRKCTPFPRNIDEYVDQHEKLLHQWDEVPRSYSREDDAKSIQEDLDEIKKEFAKRTGSAKSSSRKSSSLSVEFNVDVSLGQGHIERFQTPHPKSMKQSVEEHRKQLQLEGHEDEVLPPDIDARLIQRDLNETTRNMSWQD